VAAAIMYNPYRKRTWLFVFVLERIFTCGRVTYIFLVYRPKHYLCSFATSLKIRYSSYFHVKVRVYNVSLDVPLAEKLVIMNI